MFLLRRGVSADARTAVILRIEPEGVGIVLRHAEGLVPVPGRVVTNVDLVVVDAAGEVLDDAKVIVRTIFLGVADHVLELLGAALLGLALLDDLGNAVVEAASAVVDDGSFLGDDLRGGAVLRTGIFAR